MEFVDDKYMKEYRRWLESPEVSEKDKLELRELSEKEIKARFKSKLEFGTAGIRRKMEVGPGGINEYTVKHITMALGGYIVGALVTGRLEKNQSLSVVIAYDSRNNSQEYAKIAARVLATMDIHVYLYESLRPTPELSFAVRYSGSAAGINITASHNTKEWNGYKVYGPDGAQISPEQAKEIAGIIANADLLAPVSMMDYDEAIALSRIDEINGYFDNIYRMQVLAQSKLPKREDVGATDSQGGANPSDAEPGISEKEKRLLDEVKNLKIVYTAFHGTGSLFVPGILERDGFENVHLVEEQCVPDGDFPTVESPNPETAESFAMAIDLARSIGADLIIGTDPDGDRCGIAIPTSKQAAESADGSAGYRVLTGNQIGVLILDYLIKNREGADAQQENGPYVVKSIVSTMMANAICDAHGIEIIETPTGFKFIGEKIEELSVKAAETIDEDGTPGVNREFIFGFEESNGYLTGLYARDKDAVLASMLIAETAAYHKANGKTLEEALEDLYKEYGYYQDKLISIILDPNSDKQVSQEMKVFDFEDGSRVISRPSGTEPKIKIYISTFADTEGAALQKLKELEEMVDSGKFTN